MMSAKRKPSKEVFVLKSKESVEETVIKIVEIHDFTKRIDDLENKKKPIEGPKFKVGEKDFNIDIYPEDLREGSTHIGVSLCNLNAEKIKASFSVKHESGVKKVAKNREILAEGFGFGFPKFLSHVAYKKWAEEHGDVFKVEAEITLPVEEGNPEPEWETIPRKR